MKPTSLSMRLGLYVSLMGAMMVILLAMLAYLALSHELDSIAKQSLERKIQQLQHTLSTDLDGHEISKQPHALLDVVMGYDDLHLTIQGTSAETKILLDLGNKTLDPVPANILSSDETAYLMWFDRSGSKILTASKVMKLHDGSPVRVLLSFKRSADQALLNAYIKAALVAVPSLLVLIGMGAWWIVQSGLMPLRHFRNVASLVSAQNLTHRISAEKLPQELSELAHGINFMLHRLDNGVQQLSQFSDDLAHELRSPITNLLGKAQVTLSRERSLTEYKAVLESCTEELDRLARIVSDMLFLAQASHPASLLPFEKIALEDESRRVMDLFVLAAEEKQVQLDISGNGVIHGDRLMIQRAISNLLSNAIRHCPTGGSTNILIDIHPDKISLSVENPGAGIPAQHLPHLFERFYRVDTSRSRAEGGTGLGLAIVHSIMILHQGTVEVSSTLGGFTIFRLNFPRVENDHQL